MYCEIECVRGHTGARWRWRVNDESGPGRASKEKFELFYDCVTDARRAGYEPLSNGKLIVCGAPKKSAS